MQNEDKMATLAAMVEVASNLMITTTR